MTDESHRVSRVQAFRAMAEARAAGHSLFLPRHQSKNDRRLHIRQTLREDHQQRIVKRPQGAREKFDKLAASRFSFFRGTALLFYRDLAGEDPWSPTVLALGDVHPENFGVMPSADNAPFFGVNDFDEAYFAPFTWDIKRGATGFLGAASHHGVGKKRRKKIIREFVHGYLTGLELYAQSDRELSDQLRLDNSPPLIERLLEDSRVDRERFLAKLLDKKRAAFCPSKKLVPCTSRRAEFQGVIDTYRERCEVDDLGRAGEWKVKDVAQKLGSGTASLGLERYYVLVEGPAKDGTDDLILEFKQARRSALAGLAPRSQDESGGEAERIVTAHAVHLVGGDRFYGKAVIEDTEYLVRERSPYKNEVDLSELNYENWGQYAKHCGQVLAQAHARSDSHLDPGRHEVEKRILLSIAEPRVFVHDVVCFAQEAYARLKRDHRVFKKEHARGAFDFSDSSWR